MLGTMVTCAANISGLGIVLTYFAIDIWLYQVTQSYSSFIYITVASSLTGFIISPIAGSIVDRKSKKLIALLCEFGIIFVSLILIYLAIKGKLNFTSILIISMLISIIINTKWTLINSLLPMLVDDHNSLKRLNGFSELLRGTVLIIGPLLSLWFIKQWGVIQVFYTNLIISAIILVFFHVSLKENQEENNKKDFNIIKKKIIKDFIIVCRWVFSRKKLKDSMILLIASNLCFAIYSNIQIPHLQSHYSADVLARNISNYGIGTICGGIVCTVFGTKIKSESNIYLEALFSCLAILCWTLSKNIYVMLSCALIVGFFVPIINSSIQGLWQASVPYKLLGRVFAVRRMFTWCLNPILLLLTIPINGFILSIFEYNSYIASLASNIWYIDNIGSSTITLSIISLVVIIKCYFLYKRQLI